MSFTTRSDKASKCINNNKHKTQQMENKFYIILHRNPHQTNEQRTFSLNLIFGTTLAHFLHVRACKALEFEISHPLNPQWTLKQTISGGDSSWRWMPGRGVRRCVSVNGPKTADRLTFIEFDWILQELWMERAHGVGFDGWNEENQQPTAIGFDSSHEFERN